MSQDQPYQTQGQLNGQLRHACRYGNIDKVKELIEEGAEIDGADIYGQTPLHGAARWGYFVIVRLLVEKGAKIDTQTHEGITPIDLAKKYNHVKVADYLEWQLKQQQEKAAS